MSARDLEDYIEELFPGVLRKFSVQSVEPKGCVTVKYTISDRDMRPGGTVMGPSLMLVVDVATFLAMASLAGPEKMAVTSSLNIQFLKKPPKETILCTTEVLKLGQRTAVVDARLYSESDDALCAKATVTFARPQS